MIDTFVFDVDGTLVDTNYQHAVSWFRAFQRFDITPPLWRIHRAIGMGGDQLVEAVAGKEEMLPRLDELEDDLLNRRQRAIDEGWRGEVEGLELTLRFLRSKRDQARRATRLGVVSLGIPTFPRS